MIKDICLITKQIDNTKAVIYGLMNTCQDSDNIFCKIQQELIDVLGVLEGTPKESALLLGKLAQLKIEENRASKERENALHALRHRRRELAELESRLKLSLDINVL